MVFQLYEGCLVVSSGEKGEERRGLSNHSRRKKLRLLSRFATCSTTAPTLTHASTNTLHARTLHARTLHQALSSLTSTDTVEKQEELMKPCHDRGDGGKQGVRIAVCVSPHSMGFDHSTRCYMDLLQELEKQSRSRPEPSKMRPSQAN